MKKVDIGLDIGIASVGWAITDPKDLSIIKHGVRLFPTVDDPKDSKLKNESRREARSARRQTNRRRTLKRDFVKFLIDQKVISDIEFDLKGNFLNDFFDKYINNAKLQKKWDKSMGMPFTFVLRKKALKEKLDINELIPVLYWYINHRGFKYTTTEDSDAKLDVDKEKLPVDIQLEYFAKNGYINGELNRSFHQNDYLKELSIILKNQKLSSDIEKGFLNLFERQRSFEIGAGPSTEERARAWILGSGEPDLAKLRYSTWNYNEETKQLTRDENMWDKTIGRCSIYPNEYRAPKQSLTSAVFNLLSELNNISEKGQLGQKLNTNQKIEILKIALETKAASQKIANKICEFYSLEKGSFDDFSGYVKDTKDAPKFIQLDVFHAFKKLLPNKYLEFNYLFGDGFNSDNIFDKLADIFSKTKIIEKRHEKIEELFKKENITNVNIDEISKVKGLSFSDTHAFSYLAMQKMIPYLLEEEGANQYKWIHINIDQEEFRKNSGHDYGSTYLKTDWIEELIGTPTVKRAFRQTTKVLNAIFQYCKDNNYEIDDIVIEMTREKNNKSEKDNKKNTNKYFAEKNKEIQDFLNNKFSGKSNNNNYQSKRVIEKLWLLEQQRGHDAYTGEKIELEYLLANPGLFDIDHIIPYSQSFSNNRSNKVLTRNSINIKKSNRTPHQYLSTENFARMKTLWLDWYRGNENERKAFRDSDKLDFLTTELDYTKPENQLGFIGRNLVDTSYTTKAILEALKGFQKSSKNNYSFKVKTINGKMTSFARRNVNFKVTENGVVLDKLKRPLVNGEELSLFEKVALNQNDPSITRKVKSRIWHGHHAEDAYFITVLNRHYKDSKSIEKVMTSPHIKFSRFKSERDAKLNNFAQRNFKELYDDFDIARDQLNLNMDKMRFSRMVEKKSNTKLFNETLYSGRINDVGKIDKISFKTLLGITSKDKLFGKDDSKKESLLIFRNNKPLYNELNSIYKNYEDDKEPFRAALEEASNSDSENSYWRNGINVSYKSQNGKLVNAKVNKLRIVSLEAEKGKKSSRVIMAPNNGNSFYESMKWIQIQVYKNKDDKWKLITVDASNHIFNTNKRGKPVIIPKTEVLNKQKEEKNIDLNAIPSAIINKGEIIQMPNKELYFVCGHSEADDKLELKTLIRKKIDTDQKQLYKSINSALKNAKIIKQNVLGKLKASKFIF